VSRRFEIPGAETIVLEHLLLDVNGTLTDRGELLPGVEERLRALGGELDVHLLSADTFGTLDALAAGLSVDARRVGAGAEKATIARELGSAGCAAIGNGRNDAEMFAEVRLAFAVLGPEGLSRDAIEAADLLCPSIQSALDLLGDPEAMAASLRP
jgi:soluble P-type ATPase